MKDIFGNKKPVVIEIGEWWYNGNIIQKQNHPLLRPYVTFSDDENSCFVTDHNTKKEAVQWCQNNPCKKPDHFPGDYVGRLSI